jgi:molybdopterin-guanine dinucleotide biosynthesis protein A
MDCVLLAGGQPRADDPLYAHTQGQPKALLEVAGRPLVDYILRALLAAQSVDQIAVIGLPAPLAGDYGPAVEYLPDQGSMIANGLAGVAHHRQRRPATRHLLFASADIPTATGPMIDHVVARCRPFAASAYYFMVERQVMEAHFPGSKRTYTRLRDRQVAGADLIIADACLADTSRQLFDDISASRKQPWKLARIAGLSTILALLTRRLTLEGIQRRATRVLGAPVSVSLLEYPQLAMDIDKPEQLALLRQHGYL